MKTKGARLLSVVPSDRARSNGHETHEIPSDFFTVRVTDSGHRLPREVVESPSLEIF